MKQLDVFQLKGLRKILGMTTTFVNRANTTAKVFEEIHKAANPPNNTRKYKEIRPFHSIYKHRKLLLAQQILTLPNRDPIKEATMNPDTLRQVDLGIKRVGRPTAQWIDTATRQLWDVSKFSFLSPFRRQQYDPTSSPHRRMLVDAAQRKLFL